MIYALTGFVVVVLAAMITYVYMRAYYEKKRFNNGKCEQCGQKLILTDRDFDGDREYTCSACGNTVWVSFRGVDKKYLHGQGFYFEKEKQNDHIES